MMLHTLVAEHRRPFSGHYQHRHKNNKVGAYMQENKEQKTNKHI